MTKADIDRACNQMKAGLLMGLESPASRCERLARMVGIWGRVPSLEEVVGKIDAVSVQAVSDYAERLCAKSTPSMALYGPVEQTPTVESLADRLAA
jgi:predicted Zn-dependent peptidase